MSCFPGKGSIQGLIAALRKRRRYDVAMVSGFFSGSMTKALPAALVAAAAGLVTAVPVALAAPGPVATSLPTVSGTATVGQTLTATNGSWTGTSAYSYRWQRCENATPSASVLGRTGTNSEPVGIAVDSSGNVFTANFNAGSITKITPSGSATSFGALPSPSAPQGIAVDLDGNVYVTNSPNGAGPLRLTPAGTPLPLGSGVAGDNTGIAVDSEGNIFMTSPTSTPPYISKQNSAGTPINNPYAPGNPWGGILPPSPGPEGIAVDASGAIYVALSGADQVWRVSPDGNAGTWGGSLPGANPVDVAVDNFSGAVYSANRFGGYVSKATQTGSVGAWAPVDGVQTSIAVDSEGNVYVATDNDRVSKILPSGTPAGAPWPINVRAGSGTQATPKDIAVDPDGNIYTANFDGDSVTKIGSSLDCADIAGATSQSYRLTAADQGKRVRVKVSAVQVGGSGRANANSQATAAIAQAGGGSGGGGSGGGGSGGGGSGGGTSDDGSLSVTSIKSKVSKKGAYITSRVRVAGAGRINQRATTGSKKLVTRCRASKTMAAAGTQTLKCNLGSKGRKALKKNALKLTLRTGFTPAGGSAVFVNLALTLKRKR